MTQWFCECGAVATTLERPACESCGARMMTIAEVHQLPDHMVDVTRLRSFQFRIASLEAWQKVVGANPVALVEARIATSSLAELDELNEKLEALGVRMVERAADMRRKLREVQAEDVRGRASTK